MSGLGEIFNEIYRTWSWEGGQSRSGKGAGDIERDLLAPDILALVDELSVSSVLDVGCGETYWTPELPGYIGIDVSERAISVAKHRHPDWDLRVDDGSPYPHVELVMSRCVIQHLSYASALGLVERVRATGATWFLVTSYRQGGNIDIKDGAGFWPDMRVAPFNFGEPLREITDGRTDNEWHEATLGLWSLR